MFSGIKGGQKLMNAKYPNLSKPIRIGNVVAKHRIFSAPTGLMGYTPEGHLTTDNRAFFEYKASGGCAVVSMVLSTEPADHLIICSRHWMISRYYHH